MNSFSVNFVHKNNSGHLYFNCDGNTQNQDFNLIFEIENLICIISTLDKTYIKYMDDKLNISKVDLDLMILNLLQDDGSRNLYNNNTRKYVLE